VVRTIIAKEQPGIASIVPRSIGPRIMNNTVNGTNQQSAPKNVRGRRKIGI
jgi:hypothetical protein